MASSSLSHRRRPTPFSLAALFLLLCQAHSGVRASCSSNELLSSSSGSFTDGSSYSSSYSNNLDCLWLIQPGYSGIKLSFSRFQTEYFHDTVRIYDGFSTSSKLIAAYSGTSTPDDVTSTGSSLLVRFTTDSSVVNTGFYATYQRYVPAASTHDIVRIYEGSSTSSTPIATYSGTSTPADVTTTGSSLLVRFTTDSSVVDTGFYATYQRYVPPATCSGTTSTSFKQIAVYSGSSTPDDVTTTGSSLLVRFTTDSSVVRTGFYATYERYVPPASTCRGTTTTLSSSSGAFNDGSSPSLGYSNGLDCRWLIQPGYTGIRLSFSRFRTESTYDTIRIYDGSTTSSYRIATYSGTSTPDDVISTGSSLLVRFTTDSSVVDTGFYATYQRNVPASTCSGTTTLRSSSGGFSDGSTSSSDYSNGLDCRWLIQLGYSGIELSFSRFQTESTHDTVRIYDGSSTSSKQIATYSGTSTPDDVTTSGSSLLVRFTTDSSVVNTGFYATYQQDAPPPATCSGTTYLTSSGGGFNDGSSPSSVYTNGLDCRWLIQPGYSGIELSFSRFRTESTHDRVRIYDGSSTYSSYLIATYSGTSTKADVTTSGSSLLVRFTTDSSIVDTGFYATYQRYVPVSTCSGTTYLRSSSGGFTDGSSPSSDYTNGLDCRWVIQPGYSGIELSFSRFRTEWGDDTVRIYDGSSTSSPRIATYSGTSLPSNVTSTGSSLLVRFTTDSSRVETGFYATYQRYVPPATCSGTTYLRSSSGGFTDGSSPSSDYTNGLDCRWVIQPGYSGIELSFSRFRTERNHDTVRIYDGSSTSTPQIVTYSGSSLPSNVTSTGISLLVRFTTDSSVVDTGFYATYRRYSVPPASLAPGSVSDSSDEDSVGEPGSGEETVVDGSVTLGGISRQGFSWFEQEFLQAIASIAGVAENQVTLVSAETVDSPQGSGDGTQVVFQVQGIASKREAEDVAERIEKAVGLPADDDRSLTSALHASGLSEGVSVLDVDVGVLDDDDGDKAPLGVIIGVPLGAVALLFGAALHVYWLRSKTAVNDISYADQDPSAEAAPALVDYPQDFAEDTPTGPKEPSPALQIATAAWEK